MTRQIHGTLAAILLMASIGCNPPVASQAVQQAQRPTPEVVDAKDLLASTNGPVAPPSMGLFMHLPAIRPLQLPVGSVRVKDKIPGVGGRCLYAAEVPGGGTVKAQVVEGRMAWLQVLAVNDRGSRDGPGLNQNRFPHSDPQASYRNSGKEPRLIYFVVQALDSSMADEEFVLEVLRD